MLTPQDIERLRRAGAPAPADVELYETAPDNGLIYDPLTREAKKTGAWNKYDGAPLARGTLELGGVRLEYAVPADMTAYDSVPFSYRIRCENRDTPVHMSVTAFEDPDRTGGKPCFDLNLPGRVDVDFTYLGYVTGAIRPKERPHLSADFQDRQADRYPYYDTAGPVCSGVLPTADMTWFKFGYRNTGDTILDSDGNGSFMFEPYLHKKDENGEYIPFAVPTNLFYRIMKPVYPGEDGELYVAFAPYPKYPMRSKRLEEGRYKLEIRGVVRSELKEPDFMRVVWSGTPFTISTMEFTVKENAAAAPPEPVVKERPAFPGRNGWLHSYEEFLSSFVTSSRRDEAVEEGVLAVQPAPWTRQIVVKLLIGDEQALAAGSVAVRVESDSLSIRLNPEHQCFVVRPDGRREPAVAAQSLMDMRGNVQISPYAGENILNDLLDMKDAGVNSVATTVAFAMDVGNYETRDPSAVDAFKFGADAMRVLGLRMHCPVTYPFRTARTTELAEKRTGRPARIGDADDYEAFVPANRETARYEFLRYGDNAAQLGNGQVPFDLEDTRGWMRHDLQVRYPLAPAALARFRQWLREQYQSIGRLNARWNSAFADFEDIDPAADGSTGPYGRQYEYFDRTRVFHDYSPAMADMDIFLTVERAEQYRRILEGLEDLVQTPTICLRTEGANWLTDDISPQSPNPKYRHVFFSQRRCSAIASVLGRYGVTGVHSDYTTLPYTPSEAAELTGKSVKQGILPMHLLQFNRMRDIAVNPVWGETYYTEAYNLKTPTRGVFLNTLTAVFPFWRAVYENGGIPGILWQDYLCDGFVTQTQFDEMKFFKEKLSEMLETKEGREWAERFTPPDDGFRKNVPGKWSYDPAFVKSAVKRVQDERQSKFD